MNSGHQCDVTALNLMTFNKIIKREVPDFFRNRVQYVPDE